ncbi:unnamed protein product, partial [Ectocarpus fasciculatus]
MFFMGRGSKSDGSHEHENFPAENTLNTELGNACSSRRTCHAREGAGAGDVGGWLSAMLNDRLAGYPSSTSTSTAAGDIAAAEEAMILQRQQGTPPAAAGPPKHDDGSPVVAKAELPPSRWIMVEPWSSLLLLSDRAREGGNDELLQAEPYGVRTDRKLAEALLGSREEHEAILQ